MGCSKCSPGCLNCYAEKMAYRLNNMSVDATGGHPEYLGVVDENGWTGKIECCEHRLEQPLHHKKPCRIFVCSMSDLFNEHFLHNFTFTGRIFDIIEDMEEDAS